MLDDWDLIPDQVRDLLLHHIFYTVVKPTQNSIREVPGAFTSGIKLPERECEHSFLFSAAVNVWSYIFTILYVFTWCLLCKKDSFAVLGKTRRGKRNYG